MPPRISVVILTHNRAALLQRCLASLDAQTRPADEIVVVDNASTDGTADLLARRCADQSGAALRPARGSRSEAESQDRPVQRGTVRAEQPPAGERLAVADGMPNRARAGGPRHFCVVAGQPERGWAAARNLGVRAATGDWVAFLDDDCEAATDWLAILERVAEEGFDAVGGLIEPADPLRYPWWWHGEMAWTVGLSVPGQASERSSGAVYYPSTSNLAVRRSVLLTEPFQEIEGAALAGEGAAERRVDRLKAALRTDRARDGSAGGSVDRLKAAQRTGLYAGGREDAELWRRLRRAGYRCVCDPALRVAHHVPQERLRWRRVLSRAYQDGMALQRREDRLEFLRAGLETQRTLLWDLAFGIWHGPEAPWREAAWRIVWFARQRGQWHEAFRQRPWATYWISWRFILADGSRSYWGTVKRCLRIAGSTVWRAWRGFERMRRRRMPSGRAGQRRGGEIFVAVAAAGYLGDTVLLHPFLTGLKERRPALRILLITNPTGEALYRHDPAVQDIVVVGGPEARPRDDARVIRGALAHHRIHLVLIPYWHRVAPGALFSRPEARVVTFAEEVGFPRRWWYDLADRRIAKPVGEPESMHLYRLFREAGFEGRLPEAPLAFLAEEVDAAAHYARSAGLSNDNLAVVVPGSGKSEKCWLNERWADVVRYLADEYSLRVCLVGSPAEKVLCTHIAGLADCDAIVWCEPDLRRLALLLARARIVVGCDNGPKHLAVAMDTPTLTLFGPTDERQWGALRHPQRHGVVRGCAWDLTSEERAGLPANHQMRCIATARVLAALDEMLGED